jgi:hypothetical protein
VIPRRRWTISAKKRGLFDDDQKLSKEIYTILKCDNAFYGMTGRILKARTMTYAASTESHYGNFFTTNLLSEGLLSRWTFHRPVSLIFLFDASLHRRFPAK